VDAVSVDRELVAPEHLRTLQARRAGPGLRRFSLQALLYLGTAAGLIALEGIGQTGPRSPAHWLVLGVLVSVSALVQFGMFGMLHEACHKTALADPKLNRVAAWFAALAQPMSPTLMRAFHFAHHRNTHVLERDPELAGIAMMARWPRGLMVLANLTGLAVIIARVGWAVFAALVPARAQGAWEAALPFVEPERRRVIGWEARVLLGVHAGLIALAFTLLPGLRWVYLSLWLGHVMLAWYITCEHRGLDLGGEDVLARTRSLVTPAWVRWLIWNMPYHAEHHAWPAVPWYNLPALHEQVRTHLVHRVRPLDLHLGRVSRG